MMGRIMTRLRLGWRLIDMSGVYSAVKGIFTPPKPPKVRDVVTDDDAGVKEAARLEAENLRKRRGMASTILTGPSGVTDTPSLIKATLG
jgi:hypothetical protein